MPPWTAWLKMSGPDEFEWIARLLRPLATAPEALNLMDDAAILSPPPGQDLVITADTLVAGVHFLIDDPLDLVARKALRVNLSDLAAKAATPFGYLLSIAWPPAIDWQGRALFTQGLAQDQARYGISLLGGDTVSTPGPLTISITAFGWSPKGQARLRSGAVAGHLVMVSGPIGEGWLGLQAARAGRHDGAARHYRLPEPRLDVRDQLGWTSASADVSDGLIADAGHVAEASAVRIVLDLDRMPLSAEGEAWLNGQPDPATALVRLATGGDDYQIVCTVDPARADRLSGFTAIGTVMAGQGIEARFSGRPLEVEQAGWRHGKE
jgi:thiamine-monophosphate kinase